MEYSWSQKLQNSVKMFFHFEGLSKWKCKSIKKPLTLNLSTITLQISLVMSPLVCNSRGFFLNLQLGNYRISLPGMCSVRKMFLKISQNSQENTCARAFLTQAVFLWTFQNNLELLFLIAGITPTNIDWSVANNWNTLFLWNSFLDIVLAIAWKFLWLLQFLKDTYRKNELLFYAGLCQKFITVTGFNFSTFWSLLVSAAKLKIEFCISFFNFAWIGFNRLLSMNDAFDVALL